MSDNAELREAREQLEQGVKGVLALNNPAERARLLAENPQ